MLTKLFPFLAESSASKTSAPSANVWRSVAEVRDPNNQTLLIVGHNMTTAGVSRSYMAAYNKQNGTDVPNILYLTVDASGNRGVSVSDVNAWRKMLGLAKTVKTGANAFTVASGFTLSSAQLVTAGNVAQLYIAVVKTAAAAANTEYTVGTIASASSMKPVATAAGTANARAATTWLRGDDGQVRLRPEVAYAANTAFWLSFTFIPTSWT